MAGIMSPLSVVTKAFEFDGIPDTTITVVD
jgi:hypothetical protein